MLKFDEYIHKLDEMDQVNNLRMKIWKELLNMCKEMGEEEMASVQNFWNEIMNSGESISEMKFKDKFISYLRRD